MTRSTTSPWSASDLSPGGFTTRDLLSAAPGGPPLLDLSRRPRPLSMSVKINNIRLELDDSEETLPAARPSALAWTVRPYCAGAILRKSLDARRRDDLHFMYAMEVEVPRPRGPPGSIPAGSRGPAFCPRAILAGPSPARDLWTTGPVIIGAGPAGLIAGYLLAEHGYRPLILERGRTVKDRVADVRRFDEGGSLDPESNYLFGEGGAGTFSDGKLTSPQYRARRARGCLEILADCHGKPSIVYEHRPHLGSTGCRWSVRTLRRKFEQTGRRDPVLVPGRGPRPRRRPAAGRLDQLRAISGRGGDPRHRPQRPRHLRHAPAARRPARGEAVPARRPDRAAAGADRFGSLRLPLRSSSARAQPTTASRFARGAATCSRSACAPGAT